MEESKRLDAEKKRLEEETNMLQANLEVSFEKACTQWSLKISSIYSNTISMP